MEKIDLDKLRAIPYLDLSDLQGRTLSSLCFYDDGWKFWIWAGGQLIETCAWPGEAFYFARAPERPSDLCLHTLNFIAQRASFPELMKAFVGFQDDIFNLSASIAKIELLHKHSDAVKHGVRRMVVTEVEYMLSICRSLFDLLQEMIGHLWEKVTPTVESHKKKRLKQSFADMIMHSGKLVSASDITEKYGLPEALAKIYKNYSEFFLALRAIRDNIVHRGSQVQTIFRGENGFFLSGNLRPFSKWNIWHDDERDSNNLVPLIPALGFIIHKTLSACEDLFHRLDEIIRFPSPLVPQMAFFMRGYFNEQFSEVLQDAAIRSTSLHIN